MYMVSIMRKRDYFEAYLDGMNNVTIYMRMNNYGGNSTCFYLEDEDHNQIPLFIENDYCDELYHTYECTFKEDIVFGKHYVAYHEFGRSTHLQFSEVVKTEAFDEMFYYDKNDLGANYNKDKTIFKVWAPTAYRVLVEIEKDNKTQMYEMTRCNSGVYEYEYQGDLHLASYLYYVEVNGKMNKTIDPYGKASTINSKKSVVIEKFRRFDRAYILPQMKSNTDAIIYEASIRDYSKKGNFLSFIKEEGHSALNYIKSLGVTHIQLLPVMDFKSVDDLDISKYYNWGYDAYQWFALENSYSSDIHNPLQVLNDFETLINTIHELGMRVNLDVVFNHVYDVDDCSLNKCVPYYYFQYNKENSYSNATMCGNDIDSTRKMCRKIIVDSCLYLLKRFDIDGLRFDLMGILDIDTINEVKEKCKKIKSDFMVYGEGWNMPSYLSENKRASLYNSYKMEDVAFFSDRFRDVVKGSTSKDAVYDLGFMLGNTQKMYECMNVLGGSTQDIGGNILFKDASQAVNYVECHDNMTSWDKIDRAIHESKQVKILHHRMLLATIILAQGIPFIHGGQEFLRTKNGMGNTYNAPDSINKINWKQASSNIETIRYVQELIEIRKEFPCLRKCLGKDIHKNVYYKVVDGGILKYIVWDKKERVTILFNPTYQAHPYVLDSDEEMIFYNTLLKEKEKPSNIIVNGLTVVILRKDV